MIGKFIYSKFKLLFQRRTKYKFKTLVNKNTVFEGKNKVTNGDFSNSYFGFGSISGSSLPNCKIGKYSAIGRDCHIIPAFHNYSLPSINPLFYKSNLLTTEDGYYAEIGNDVWIGSNVLIRGGVKIGDGAIVGMGSVITKNVPPYSIVAGVPAKIIKMRFSDDYIRKIQGIQWWDIDYKLLCTLCKDTNIDSFINNIELMRKNNEKTMFDNDTKN